jgi:hypothetical protein
MSTYCAAPFAFTTAILAIKMWQYSNINESSFGNWIAEKVWACWGNGSGVMRPTSTLYSWGAIPIVNEDCLSTCHNHG